MERTERAFLTEDLDVWIFAVKELFVKVEVLILQLGLAFALCTIWWR